MLHNAAVNVIMFLRLFICKFFRLIKAFKLIII